MKSFALHNLVMITSLLSRYFHNCKVVKLQLSLFHKIAKGAFNNYVDKKRGRGGQPKVYACPPRGGSLNVHVDQNLAISEGILYYCALQWVVKKK